MNRGANPGGTSKCRKFTRLVDNAKTTSVISAVLAGMYCPCNRRTSDTGSNEIGATSALGPWLLRYSLCVLVTVSTLWANSAAFARVHVHAMTGAHPGRHAAAPAQASDRDDASVAAGSVIETGTASYYGRRHQGGRTASGGTYDQRQLTAAHPWLPFGSRVRVTLVGTSRSVVVVVTDRLYSNRRVIDLSMAAAQALGMVQRGLATVALSQG